MTATALAEFLEVDRSEHQARPFEEDDVKDLIARLAWLQPLLQKLAMYREDDLNDLYAFVWNHFGTGNPPPAPAWFAILCQKTEFVLMQLKEVGNCSMLDTREKWDKFVSAIVDKTYDQERNQAEETAKGVVALLVYICLRKPSAWVKTSTSAVIPQVDPGPNEPNEKALTDLPPQLNVSCPISRTSPNTGSSAGEDRKSSVHESLEPPAMASAVTETANIWSIIGGIRQETKHQFVPPALEYTPAEFYAIDEPLDWETQAEARAKLENTLFIIHPAIGEWLREVTCVDNPHTQLPFWHCSVEGCEGEVHWAGKVSRGDGLPGRAGVLVCNCCGRYKCLP